MVDMLRPGAPEPQKSAIINQQPGSEVGYHVIENGIHADMELVAAEAEAIRQGPESYRIRNAQGLASGSIQNLPIIEASTRESLDRLEPSAPELKKAVEELEGISGAKAESVTLLFSTPGTEIPPHRDPESVAAPKAFALVGIKGTGELRINPDPALGMNDTFTQQYGPGDVIILDPIAVYEEGEKACVVPLSGPHATDPAIRWFVTRTHEATSGSENRTVALIALSVDTYSPAVQAIATFRAQRLATVEDSPYYIPPPSATEKTSEEKSDEDGPIVINIDDFKQQ